MSWFTSVIWGPKTTALEVIEQHEQEVISQMGELFVDEPMPGELAGSGASGSDEGPLPTFEEKKATEVFEAVFANVLLPPAQAPQAPQRPKTFVPARPESAALRFQPIPFSIMLWNWKLKNLELLEQFEPTSDWL